MRGHAVLSPSAAKRWMACPPSARAEAKVERADTAYSAEGSLAHEMAETILVSLLWTDGLVGTPMYGELRDMIGSHRWEMIEELKVKAGEEGEEMCQSVYEDYVMLVFDRYLMSLQKDPSTRLYIEAKLDLTAYIPEGFGSADAIIIGDDKCYVYDLKWGKGVRVDAMANPQMMCYALGAVTGVGELSAVGHIITTIIQPRLHHISAYAITYDALIAWAQTVLKPAALKAFNGEGTRLPGEHCKFCAVRSICKTSMIYAKCAMEEFSGNLSADERAEALQIAETVKAWASKVESESLEAALRGESIPGYKVVEGRSVRKIIDAKGASEALLQSGVAYDNIYKTEMRTLTELEKMLGRDGKTILAPYIGKPAGKPTLVTIDDKRPPMNTAAEDFKSLIND